MYQKITVKISILTNNAPLSTLTRLEDGSLVIAESEAFVLVLILS